MFRRQFHLGGLEDGVDRSEHFDLYGADIADHGVELNPRCFREWAAVERDFRVAPERRVIVQGPLYRFEFSNYGARMHSAELLQFAALNRDGPVNLVPDDADGYLGQKLVVGSDTIDLSRVPFSVEPEGGLRLEAGGGAATLRFVYEHPTSPFRFETEYEFDPDEYTVHVRGVAVGLDRPLLLTDFVFVDSDAVSNLIDDVVTKVGDFVDASEVQAPASDEVERIYARLEQVVPAEHCKTLADILNASWRAFENPQLWESMREVFTNKDSVLQELVLKNIELFEIEHLTRNHDS